MKKKEQAVSRNENETKKRGRRGFLKKAAYSTPTLVALGTLIRPEKGQAGFGGPPSDPNGWQ